MPTTEVMSSFGQRQSGRQADQFINVNASLSQPVRRRRRAYLNNQFK